MSETFLIPTKIAKVEKIIHLADIHIRLFKRHSEYRAVFSTLYENLKKRDLKNTAIVVAGDIVHAKTDMSPEMVKVASEFLRNLADIAPTIIIAGNHDLNLANPNRLDALSPIVDNLRHNNLYYFRESGIYEFANLQIAVHSVIGLQDEWPLPSELKTSPKIALYHGPVNKAQTDVGYTVTNKVTVEAFAGYDMVLLGDIHKTQLLQEYGGPGIPEIMYAGSLIQQNHGESITGHGYVVWDVASCKAEEFVEIPNEFGYFTLTLKDSKMPDLTGIPENVRLRIFVSSGMENSVVKKVQATIRKKFNVVECTINRLVEKSTSTSTSSDDVLDNIQDVTHQNTLIKEYIENHFPGTGEDVIDCVHEINTKLNSQIGEDELPKNVHWKPIHLKFDNLFSYGPGNEVNFEDMEGLYGVFSPNATGKTSAFDALCFALYDKTPRAFKGSHIMNTRKDSFSCELEIEISGVRYVIQRNGSRKKNGEVKVDVNFYRNHEDGTQTSLNGEDRRDTNAAIRSYVGTYEDFVLTTLSVQNQNSLFIDTGQSDRKDLLSQFIGLTVFDRLFNLASDEIKEVAGALKNFKKDDFTQKLADVQKVIEVEVDHLREIDEQLSDTQEKQNSVDASIKILYGQKHPNIQQIDPEPFRKKLVASQILIDGFTDESARCKQDVDDAWDRRDKLSFVSADVIQQKEQELKTLIQARDALSKLKAKHNILLTEHSQNEATVADLNGRQFDINCNFCVANNKKAVADVKTIQDRNAAIRYELTDLHQKIVEGQKFVDERAGVEDEYKEFQNALVNYTSASAKLEAARMSQERCHNGLSAERTRMAQYQQKIDLYEKNRLLIEENNKIDLEIGKLELEIKEIAKIINQLQSSRQKIHTTIEVSKKERDDMLRMIREAEELETTYDAYETYLAVMGRDGLPYELISKVIPTLQAEVNNILSQIVEFTVLLDVDGKNINGKIVYEDDRTWPLELASGMEKFVTSLAIRVALMSVSNLPKSNFLIIDEGLGVLDADNLASMSMLFNILKTQFEFIILISHLDVVRDIADNLIEIKREDGFSYVSM